MTRNINEFTNIKNEFLDHVNKDTENSKCDVDRKIKSFAKTITIEDKIECYSDEHAYIALKDKESRENNTKCRLINPSKSKVGSIRKNDLNSIL